MGLYRPATHVALPYPTRPVILGGAVDLRRHAMQEEQKDSVSAQSELSETWQQLLGGHPASSCVPSVPAETTIPSVDVDPWQALAHAKGVEVVDLQQLHLHISDQDVEQVLQVMEEEPSPGPE